MSPMRVLSAALLLSVTAAAAAEDRDWRGPLPVRDQFPLELVALDLTPSAGDWLSRGQWAVEIGVVHANTFEIMPGHDQRVADFEMGEHDPRYSFVVDGETTRTHVRVDFGVASRVQLGIEIPLLHHGGGVLDSLIDDTHDAFGLPGNDRELRPQDQLEFDVLAGSERFRMTDSATEIGDVVVSARIGLVDGARSALSLVAEAKAPTGDEERLAGSGSWDYGLSLLGSHAPGRGRHLWHWGLGWFALGEPEALPLDFDDKLSGYFAYEYRPNVRWSVVAQLQAETSALPDQAGYEQGDPRAGIAVGFHRGGETWQISAGFTENLTTNDNTSDLGLFFLSSWRH